VIAPRGVVNPDTTDAASASWAPAAAACCPSPPPPVRESACDALFAIVTITPRDVALPLLLELLPLHVCAGYDLLWRHSFDSAALTNGRDGQELRRVLASCKASAPAEAAASTLQAQLADALQQVRDILGDVAGPAHVAWAAAHVGLDASGAAYTHTHPCSSGTL
jgi:hypothetical protein